MAGNAPIDTSDTLCLLGGSPLLKASLVNVVPACSSTPHNVLSLGLEFHEAYWTVSLDRFSVASVVLCGLLFAERGTVVYRPQFLQDG